MVLFLLISAKATQMSVFCTPYVGGLGSIVVASQVGEIGKAATSEVTECA